MLTASEIEDFCSNCHNRITGIDPSVPKKAEKALTSVNELQVGLSKARSAIITAQASGKDVTEAEADLENARTILRHIPSVWHRFNLTYFDTEVQQGITKTQEAEKALSEKPSTTAAAKSPGFEGIMLLAGALAVYLMKRR